MKAFKEIASYERGIKKMKFGYLRYLKETIIPPRSLSPCTDFKSEQLHPLVFIVIYANHFNQLKAIADVLVQKNIDFSVIYIQEHIFRKNQNAYKNQILINSLYTLRYYYSGVVRQWGMLLRTFLNKIENSIFNESDIQTILHHYKQYYMLKSVSKQILDDYCGKFILFKAEGFIARTIITECKKQDVSTYTIQHGLIADHQMFRGIQVDNYLVWSDYFKSILQKCKTKANIITVGCASMDRVFELTKKKIKRKIPIQRERLKLLFLPNSGHSTTPISQVLFSVDICIAFAMSNSQVDLIIKPHPGDVNDNVFKHVKEKYERLNNVTLIGRDEIIPFESNDITVINNSAAGMESAVWGKPLIIVTDSMMNIDVSFYLEENISELSTDHESFKKALDKILYNYTLYSDNCRKFTNKYFANHDHAVEKILSVIL